MAWLPYEDEIAGASEKLVLKYSPDWTGAGETKHPIRVSDEIYKEFEAVYHEEYNVEIQFTRETWHGRMKACRGVGASLDAEALSAFDKEHYKMLQQFPENFEILHYAAITILRANKE